MVHVILVQLERKEEQASHVFGGPRSFFRPWILIAVGVSDAGLMAFFYSRHSSESLFLLFQGCSIGCDFCLTDPRHPENNGTIPTKVLSFNKCQMLKQRAIFRKSLGTRPTATRQASASHIVRSQKQRSTHNFISIPYPPELPPLMIILSGCSSQKVLDNEHTCSPSSRK